MKRSLAYWAILFYVSVSKRVAVFLIHALHHLPETFFLIIQNRFTFVPAIIHKPGCFTVPRS